jgi:two-component system, response regulator PdtaR
MDHPQSHGPAFAQAKNRPL